MSNLKKKQEESGNLANHICCSCFGFFFLNAGQQRFQKLQYYLPYQRWNNSEILFFCYRVATGFLPHNVWAAFLCLCDRAFIET